MATKKISELPLVNRVSGSQVAGGSVLPIVIGGGIQGTTNQISVEDFSLFVNAYNATTSSNTFIGTQNVTGDVNISGRLTVKEVVAQYETASILFSTGSTKLGDQLTDKHEFTGSTNITGSLTADGFITLNGQSLNNAFDRIHQATHSLQLATASLQFHSASVNAQLLAIQQTTQSLHVATASLQFHSASVNAQLERLQQTTQSLQVATASLQAFSSSVNAQLERLQQTTQSLQVATASLQFHSASVDAQLLVIQQTTQSLQVATASLNAFTASQDSRNFVISQYTSSTDAHIVGISAFTSSQLAVNLGNSIYTASVDSHIVGISTYTSSVRDTLARVHQSTQSLQVATASLQQFTASQDSRNFVVSQVTGSLIGITNGLMAFTAALDNTYATDAQLYQLYQSTRSLELHSGSMVGVTNGLMAYTASNNTLNTGLRDEVNGIEAYTASLKGQAIVSSSTQIQNYDVFALNSNLYNGTGSIKAEVAGIESYTASLKAAAIVSSSTQVQNYDVFALNSNLYTSTGSLIGITNGLMAFTAALDSTYATDAQLFQLYQATRSIELTTGSLIGITNGLMAFTAALDNTYATDAQLYQLYAETASIKAEIGGIEAYTASLKGAEIVSSSQQVQNYFTFAKTGSANTFYGNQNISGSLTVNSTGASGISINSSNDNPTLNFTQLAQANSSARNWRFVSNYEAWGTIDLQVSNDHTTLPSTLTRVSITGGGDVNLKTGNLIFANGKGIDFSATANSGSTVTSEILDDYEVGTWTPTDGTGAGLTFTTVFGRYVKIGKQVTVHFRVNYPSTADATAAIIGGLPYVVDSGNNYMGGVVHWTDASMVLTLMAIDTTSTLSVRRNADNADPTNANLSTKILRGTVTYQTF